MNPLTHPPALARLLDDPAVTDVCINGPASVHADRGSGLTPLPPESVFRDAGELRQWCLAALSSAGQSWDARRPFSNLTLPEGHRVHLVFPPVSGGGHREGRGDGEGILVSIRRRATPDRTTGRWSDSEAFGFLRDAYSRGATILLSGATGSGKTTLASDLLSVLPPRERVIALEDTRELAPAHPHFLSLCSRAANADGFGAVSLRQLMKQTLRMRPDRIVLGECRGEEVFELLQMLNTGHAGGLATIHANSARDALRRVELLCLLAAGAPLPHSVVRELIASGIGYVAHLSRAQGGRYISEIQEIAGREGDTILLRPMLRTEVCQAPRRLANASS